MFFLFKISEKNLYSIKNLQLIINILLYYKNKEDENQ